VSSARASALPPSTNGENFRERKGSTSRTLTAASQLASASGLRSALPYHHDVQASARATGSANAAPSGRPSGPRSGHAALQRAACGRRASRPEGVRQGSPGHAWQLGQRRPAQPRAMCARLAAGRRLARLLRSRQRTPATAPQRGHATPSGSVSSLLALRRSADIAERFRDSRAETIVLGSLPLARTRRGRTWPPSLGARTSSRSARPAIGNSGWIITMRY
jgi:hypothetical protein